MFRVRIEKVDEVWQKQRTYQRLKDDPSPGENQYGYVDAELPTTKTTLLLDQSLESVDMAAVIKAINGL